MDSLDSKPSTRPAARQAAVASDSPSDVQAALTEALYEEALRGVAFGRRTVPVNITFNADGDKVLDFFGPWGHLRHRGIDEDEVTSLFVRGGSRVNGLCWILEDQAQGTDLAHYVVETDSPEALALLSGFVLPHTLCAKTPRGYHYHFLGERGLFSKDKVIGAAGLELLSNRVVIVPPSLGVYEWEDPNAPLAMLPPALVALFTAAEAAGAARVERSLVTGEAAQVGTATEEDLDAFAEEARPWAELLPDFHRDGKNWKGTCPFPHDNADGRDTHASFGVYRAQRTKRLRGHCFGCGWDGSLSQLRRELRKRQGVNIALARKAADAIASYGDTLEPQVLTALLEIQRLVQERNLHPREPVHIIARRMALLTGCEPVDAPKGGLPEGGTLEKDGVPRYQGKGVSRLNRKLEALGVEIVKGSRHTKGTRGKPTGYKLPAAWFAR